MDGRPQRYNFLVGIFLIVRIVILIKDLWGQFNFLFRIVPPVTPWSAVILGRSQVLVCLSPGWLISFMVGSQLYLSVMFLIFFVIAFSMNSSFSLLDWFQILWAFDILRDIYLRSVPEVFHTAVMRLGQFFSFLLNDCAVIHIPPKCLYEALGLLFTDWNLRFFHQFLLLLAPTTLSLTVAVFSREHWEAGILSSRKGSLRLANGLPHRPSALRDFLDDI